jgi:hypothetical protein
MYPASDLRAEVSVARQRAKHGFGEQLKGGRVGKIAPVEDCKIKARPAGVLIVVVGVEVKGASHEFACWRIF